MSQDKPVLSREQIEELRPPEDYPDSRRCERWAGDIRALCDLALIGLGRQGSVQSDDGLDKKLERAINSVSAENQSNTPDFILANFLMNALAAVDMAIQQRDKWYGIRPAPHASAQINEPPQVTGSPEHTKDSAGGPASGSPDNSPRTECPEIAQAVRGDNTSKEARAAQN
jgi:hypothetical protein